MQLHKRLNTSQVKAILKGYIQGSISSKEALNLLGVKRSRFFLLVKKYRENPNKFSLNYQRKTPKRIAQKTEEKIKHFLDQDHQLVVDPNIPITHYNYSAIKDQLAEKGVTVSIPTIINRAKQYDYYIPRKKRKKLHDQEVITNNIGELIQHDASIHLWSPYAESKWTLITSLDDYSRKLLYGDFVKHETTFRHIKAAKQLVTSYGVPLSWYVDSLRIFRWVAHGKSIWVNQTTHTDQVNPQWKQAVETIGAKVIFALSPQAKGKIERPYRWLQDRIVRTCAKEKIKDISEVREVLRFEISRYNYRQVHSTTKEIPHLRFERAKKEDKTLFKPLSIPKPYTHLNDIFCLKTTRTTNPYRKITLQGTVIQIAKVPPREEVTIHLVPDKKRKAVHLRIWWQDKLVFRSSYPKTAFPKVQF